MGGRWLLKTEAEEWSWEDQASNGGISRWDGVRNAQAQNNMKKMEVGDLCFFYHTGNQRSVVGIVKVIKPFYPDDPSSKYGAVDVQEVSPLKEPVILSQLKSDPFFSGFTLLKQPRLSVVPVDEPFWERICDLGGVSVSSLSQLLTE